MDLAAGYGKVGWIWQGRQRANLDIVIFHWDSIESLETISINYSLCISQTYSAILIHIIFFPHFAKNNFLLFDFVFEWQFRLALDDVGENDENEGDMAKKRENDYD